MKTIPLLRLSSVVILFLFSACSRPAVTPNAPGDANAPKPTFTKVLTIVLENQNYEDAMKDSYLKTLADGGVLFTHSNGVTHPSYPNYIAMTAGDFFKIPGDDQISISDRTIADLVEEKGLTWKNYADGFPGHCNLKAIHKRYARKHVPFMSFKGVVENKNRCKNVVSEKQFQIDWKTGKLPEYSFFTPDMDHDGHDTGLKAASKWVRGFLEPLLADREHMKDLLIILTFDESASYEPNYNHIYTVFLGPTIKPGTHYDGLVDHYQILRTIEDRFALGTLGKNDSKRSPIEGIWK